MYLSHIKIIDHPILGDISIDLINSKTNKPYSIVAFVGENGCGKTTLLNELFKYQESKNIIEKEYEPLSLRHYFSLFLRQSSLARNAMKEIGKLIDGKDRYSASNIGAWADGFKLSNPELEKEKGIEMLKILNDPDIYKLYDDGAIDKVACGAEISKLIDGKKAGYDISKYSSGQQEILLKLKDLKDYFYSIDSVLLDEPETSLHPRWQKKIIDLIKMFVTDNNDTPQIFVATHSEKILESLLENKDALIIRLFRDGGVIKSERIEQMNLALPNPSFAELDYVVFNIDSFEYCSELHDLLEWKYDVKGDFGVDRHIMNSEFFKRKLHYKEWINDRYNKVSSHNIATYCRNYFHHPKDREKPTEKELHLAIELLRNIILNLDKK